MKLHTLGVNWLTSLIPNQRIRVRILEGVQIGRIIRKILGSGSDLENRLSRKGCVGSNPTSST